MKLLLALSGLFWLPVSQEGRLPGNSIHCQLPAPPSTPDAPAVTEREKMLELRIQVLEQQVEGLEQEMDQLLERLQPAPRPEPGPIEA